MIHDNLGAFAKRKFHLPQAQVSLCACSLITTCFIRYEASSLRMTWSTSEDSRLVSMSDHRCRRHVQWRSRIVVPGLDHLLPEVTQGKVGRLLDTGRIRLPLKSRLSLTEYTQVNGTNQIGDE